MQAMIQQRFESCRLRLNEEKTKIVYCKSSRQKECYPNVTFDFLGFTFQPRESVDKYGNRFMGFLPVISQKSMKRINETIHSWNLNRHSNLTLERLAADINPIVRGWMTYYGKFYPTRLKWFMQTLNGRLARWVICNSSVIDIVSILLKNGLPVLQRKRDLSFTIGNVAFCQDLPIKKR